MKHFVISASIVVALGLSVAAYRGYLSSTEPSASASLPAAPRDCELEAAQEALTDRAFDVLLKYCLAETGLVRRGVPLTRAP